MSKNEENYNIFIADASKEMKYGHSRWVLRINERSDIGDAERTEQFLALGRGEPVSFVLDAMVRNDGGHGVSSGVVDL